MLIHLKYIIFMDFHREYKEAMRQQRNQDSSSIYRPKDSPTLTPDGQAHVQFASPECVTATYKAGTTNQRNLSLPNSSHPTPKSIISQQSQMGNGHGSSKVNDNSPLAFNGNQTYHTPDAAVHLSSYENMPKMGDVTSSPALTKDYGSYVKPSSPLKNNGNGVLSPTASKIKSTTVSTSKVTR